MIHKKNLVNGFTLAEIIISTLLLSIFAVGTFYSSYYAQHAANITLKQFLKLNQDQLQYKINKLGQGYSTIYVDSQFPLLKCVSKQNVGQGSDQEADCNQVQQ